MEITLGGDLNDYDALSEEAKDAIVVDIAASLNVELSCVIVVSVTAGKPS